MTEEIEKKKSSKGLGKNIGRFVSGSFSELILRKKSDQEFEIGQLLVAGNDLDNYAIYQINDLKYGSQIPDDSLELMTGYQLERDATDFQIYEPELRTYVLAEARALVQVNAMKKKDGYELFLPKTLPQFFGQVYEINKNHLAFLEKQIIQNPLSVGKVRSGSHVLDINVSLPAEDVLTHHVLIPATTGRGKSNLVKVMLYNILENEQCGKLVFDPHNEYFKSLTKHPKSSNQLRYYTIRGTPGSLDLRFNVGLLRPRHIAGAIDLSDAQRDALTVYYRNDRDNWIENIFIGPEPSEVHRNTIPALRRRVGILLNMEVEVNDDGDEEVVEHGIYTIDGHETIIDDIIKQLKEGKTVVADTSLLGGNEEIFVATIIVETLFREYKRQKFDGTLDDLPVISIILEEAPRVIGRKVLEVRENIFGTIAKEGRKFNIGLVAITQLPSIIPREILANMNTKIVLGNEMGPERKAIIESASQDLSDDYQNIGSLDKGEAIITSNFTKFAIPIKIPLFEDLVAKSKGRKDNDKVKTRSPF